MLIFHKLSEWQERAYVDGPAEFKQRGRDGQSGSFNRPGLIRRKECQLMGYLSAGFTELVSFQNLP
jgi:hypothetical protein